MRWNGMELLETYSGKKNSAEEYNILLISSIETGREVVE
jgi:hypothetical protein